MKFRPASLVCLLLLALPGRAQLGETDAALLKRYGPALKYSSHTVRTEGRSLHLGTSINFKHEGWEITSDLIGDRCARLRYNKRGKWTDADIVRLLEANRQEEQWTEKSEKPKVRRDWARPDGSTARWTRNGMVLTSAVYHQARAKAEEDAKKTDR